MDQNQLAELLEVSIDAVKSWRTKRMEKSPLFLKPDLPGKKALYSPANVARWLERNPDYKARVIAVLSPELTFMQQPANQQPANQHPASTLGLAVIIPDTYQLAPQP